MIPSEARLPFDLSFEMLFASNHFLLVFWDLPTTACWNGREWFDFLPHWSFCFCLGIFPPTVAYRKAIPLSFCGKNMKDFREVLKKHFWKEIQRKKEERKWGKRAEIVFLQLYQSLWWLTLMSVRRDFEFYVLYDFSSVPPVSNISLNVIFSCLCSYNVLIQYIQSWFCYEFSSAISVPAMSFEVYLILPTFRWCSRSIINNMLWIQFCDSSFRYAFEVHFILPMFL